MYFNSYIFILFFLPVSVAGYFLLQQKGWKRAAASYIVLLTLWFCGYENPWNTVVFVLLILLNYFFAQMIQHKGRRWLIAGVIFDAAVLVCFKFWGALPLGISFYTFQLIAYLADTDKGKCEDVTFPEYLQYMCFFPRLLQGPIVLQGEFIPELRKEANRQVSYDCLGRGLYAFALGLGKKVLLADSLAKIVNQGYADVTVLNGTEALLVMLAYTLQLYFDFSGYCDMACGIGLMLRLELPVNFNSPYKAASVSDFWDRWHMTLTRFFTRYVYIPLGGSRKGTVRTLRNIMIVFLLSGFWHGTSLTFLIWGALHGIWMIWERVTGYEKWKLPHGLKVARTFVFNVFAWSIFRAESLTQVLQLWNRLFTGGFHKITEEITTVFNDAVEVRALVRLGVFTHMEAHPGIPAVILVLLLLAACFFMKNTSEKVVQMKWNGRKLAVTAGLIIWSVLSLADITQFLYVNF